MSDREDEDGGPIYSATAIAEQHEIGIWVSPEGDLMLHQRNPHTGGNVVSVRLALLDDLIDAMRAARDAVRST
ncbi:hypothetical protein ACUSIJ_28860 [Pseudochelatococcus sp. B33]